MLKPLIEQQQTVTIELCVPFVSPNILAQIWAASSTDEKEVVLSEHPVRNYVTSILVEKKIAECENSIRDYVYRGEIPSFHLGKRLVINITRQAMLDAASLPFPLQINFTLRAPSLPIDAFATYTGFSRGVIEGWIKNGYVPTVGLGKHPMISLPELLRRCQEWTPEEWAAIVRKTKLKSKKQLVEA